MMLAIGNASKVPTGQKFLTDEKIAALDAEKIEKIVDSINLRLNSIADGIIETEKAIGRYRALLPSGIETSAVQEVKQDKIRLLQEREILLGYFERLRRQYRKKTGWV